MISFDIHDPNPYLTQSYNRYSYALNNPLSYTDPSGYVEVGHRDDYNIKVSYFNQQCFLAGLDFVARQEMLDRLITLDAMFFEVFGSAKAAGGGSDQVGDGKDGGEGGKKLQPLYGWSVDVTICAVAGYTIEIGEIYDPNTGITRKFVSYGPAFGLEATWGINMIYIFPKANFKFSDIEGYSWGVSGTWGLSVSVSGNSTPGYGGGTQFDSYFMLKFGIGPGAGGSNTPENSTFFLNF